MECSSITPEMIASVVISPQCQQTPRCSHEAVITLTDGRSIRVRVELPYLEQIIKEVAAKVSYASPLCGDCYAFLFSASHQANADRSASGILSELFNNAVLLHRAAYRACLESLKKLASKKERKVFIFDVNTDKSSEDKISMMKKDLSALGISSVSTKDQPQDLSPDAFLSNTLKLCNFVIVPLNACYFENCNEKDIILAANEELVLKIAKVDAIIPVLTTKDKPKEDTIFSSLPNKPLRIDDDFLYCYNMIAIFARILGLAEHAAEMQKNIADATAIATPPSRKKS